MVYNWFGVLGPLVAQLDGVDRTPNAPKLRRLLGLLVVNAGEVVTTSAIVDELWPDEAPDTATAALYVYVSQLRQQLCPGVAARGPGQLVLTTKPGYRLAVDPALSDLHQFRMLTTQGRRSLDADDLDDAVLRLRSALDLWRGPALAGLDSVGPLGDHARALDEQRLTVHEQTLDAELRRGNHETALPELADLCRAHPLRERLSAHLMLALYRSGRQAEALDVYRAARELLADQLGVDPGPDLHAMHQAILTGDVPQVRASTADLRSPAPDAATIGAPAQLLPTIPDFTGRAAALADVLDGLGSGADAPDGGDVAPRMCEISGAGGSGKTALALHAAHRLRERFPDGQLYAALRGSTESPAEIGEVLHTFLVALGLDARFVPERIEERSQLLRTRLSGRQVLIVLDDVTHESQVRPLLPGAAGCAVLLTGRTRLLGIEGVTRVGLGMMEPGEAGRLLAQLIGSARTEAEPNAAAEVVRLCGLLPLAVRIAGARLSARPHRTIAEFAESLADERGRLDELVAGDLEVRTSIGLSYRACTDVQRRALRLAAALRPDDFPAWVVALLLGVPLRHGADVVDQLVDAQLIQPVGRDEFGQARYLLHDLVRIYADEQGEPDPAEDACTAHRRLVEAATELLAEAERLVVPGAGPATPDGAGSAGGAGGAPATLVELVREDPLRWATGEVAVFVRVLEHAHDNGWWGPAAGLAAGLTWLLDLRSDWDRWQRSQRLGLDAARRWGDRRAEATLLQRQGDLEWDLGRAGPAVAAYARAACAFRELGDRHALARVRLGLSAVYVDRGPARRVEVLLSDVEPVFAELGDRNGEAQALRYRAVLDRDRGDLDSAARGLVRAADAFGDLGDRRWRTYVLRGLVGIRRQQGRLGEATWMAQECLTVVRDLGDRRWEAFVLSSLAEIEVERGQLTEAEQRLRHCLDLFGTIGDRRAAALALHGLADLACRRDDPAEATTLLESGLSVFDELGDHRGVAITSLRLGQALLLGGSPGEAIGWFDRSIRLSDRVGLPVRRQEALQGRAQAVAAMPESVATQL